LRDLEFSQEFYILQKFNPNFQTQWARGRPLDVQIRCPFGHGASKTMLKSSLRQKGLPKGRPKFVSISKKNCLFWIPLWLYFFFVSL